MDEEGVRLRAACDRCHSQKLRCLKSSGAEKCDRCGRARTPCVFSPFRQKKEAPNENEKDRVSVKARLSLLDDRIDSMKEQSRNVAGAKRKRTPSSEKQSKSAIFTPEEPSFNLDNFLSHSETIGADWSTTSFPLFNDSWPDPTFDDLDFEIGNPFLTSNFTSSTTTDAESYSHRNKGLLQLPSPRIQDKENSALQAQPDPPRIPPRLPPTNKRSTYEWENHINTVHPHSEKHLIHQLSQLSIGLYDHLGTIPDKSIHDALPEGTATSQMRDLYTGYSLDQTFKLTQDLVDIYPVFINTFLRKGPSETSGSPDETPSPQGTATPEDLIYLNASQHIETTTRNPTPHDHSSILLLLSCHVRIIDVYDELFKHMSICMDNPNRQPTSQAMLYLPPKVQIGCYSPPPSSAIPMQMMLLVQLSSQLAENAAELASHLRGPQSNEEQTEYSIDRDSPDTKDEAAKLSLATAEKVKNRASEMSQQLSAVRGKILSNGFLA